MTSNGGELDDPALCITADCIVRHAGGWPDERSRQRPIKTGRDLMDLAVRLGRADPKYGSTPAIRAEGARRWRPRAH